MSTGKKQKIVFVHTAMQEGNLSCAAPYFFNGSFAVKITFPPRHRTPSDPLWDAAIACAMASPSS